MTTLGIEIHWNGIMTFFAYLSTSLANAFPGSASSPGGPPPWDRTVEVIWVKEISNRKNAAGEDEVAFRQNCIRLACESAIPRAEENTQAGEITAGQARDTYQARMQNRLINSTAKYFRLPDNVRFMVMKYVLRHHDRSGKVIRMNSPVYLQPAWPISGKTVPALWSTDYFESLETALFSLARYTSVCFAMRVEVLATLFLTRRFHVVYSPLMTGRVQPGAVSFMDHFGPLMASITIELDFTKQGGGWRPEAVNVNPLPGLQRVTWLLDKFVDQQWTRFPRTTIRNLYVLVRRYHSFRPAEAEREINKQNRVQLDPNREDGKPKPPSKLQAKPLTPLQSPQAYPTPLIPTSPSFSTPSSVSAH